MIDPIPAGGSWASETAYNARLHPARSIDRQGHMIDLLQPFDDGVRGSAHNACVYRRRAIDPPRQTAPVFSSTWGGSVAANPKWGGKAIHLALAPEEWEIWATDEGRPQSEPVHRGSMGAGASWHRTYWVISMDEGVIDPRNWSVEPQQHRVVDLGLVELQRPESAPRSLMEQARGALNKLTSLEKGWDGYDGSPVLPRVAEHARLFLEEVQACTKIAPELVPLPNGGLQLEWYVGEVEIEVEIEPDGATTILFECRSDERSEEIALEGSLDLSGVAGFFEELPS